MLKIERITYDRAPECVRFYDHVITATPDMDRYGHWKRGLYPTEEDITNYIQKSAMYMLVEDNVVIGAMAVTMKQDDDYHSVGWQFPLADDEVSVLHVLAVDPDYQGKGYGKILIDEAVSIARKKGKKALRLDAIAGNIPAHRLYTKKGFVCRGKKNLYAVNTGWIDFLFFEMKL